MPNLVTTFGPKRADELGMILPHEHVFVDLRPYDQPGYAQAEATDVIALMAPELMAARAAGVTALVECTPVGVGRRADILKAVSEATGMPLVVPTGIYREPWVPDWAQAASEDALCEWMLTGRKPTPREWVLPDTHLRHADIRASKEARSLFAG